MLVVGDAAPEADGVDGRIRRAPFAFAEQLGLPGVDARLVCFAVAAGDAVQRIVLRHRQTEEAVVEDVGTAERLPVVARRRIQLAAAGYPVIVRVAAEGVGMQREIAGPCVEQHGAVRAFIGAAEAGAEFRADAARRQRGGNAVVARFNHAADRLRAEAQGGGPPDHVDAVGGERIDRHEMILAEVGRAIGADAVFLDAHAVDVETADHRTAGGARRET